MEVILKKVSIIIPVFQVEKYLEECLLSVLRQTYSELEIILIDDGSLDSSGEICDIFARKDSRVVVFHQKNEGSAKAKNVGLDYVSGDYIAFMDSDDVVSLDWIADMVTALENTGADVVECCFDKLYTDGNFEANSFRCEKVITSDFEYLNGYLFDWSCSLFWNKLFKAEVLKTIRFHEERRCIDDEFFTYKALSNAKKIVRINRVLYHYRQRLSGAVYSESHQIQITNDALDVLIERYQWIKKIYPKLKTVYFTHDVEMLHCFARSFNFDEKAVKKFKRIAKYYQIRCIFYLSKINIINCIQLLFISKQKLLMNKSQKKIYDIDRYFV